MKRQKSNHRKIYKDHYGSIPIDQDGRSYDIHHIDGNHLNNDPLNLKAITIQEHFDIHYAQGDYGACRKIAMRMKKSPEMLSEISKLSVQQQMREGKHSLSGKAGSLLAKHNMKIGKNKLGDKEWQKEKARKTIANGNFNFQGEQGSQLQQRRIKSGTHPLFGKSGSDLQKRLIAENKHPFSIKMKCPICLKEMHKASFVRYGHGEDCKK
jgi:hypothetical protein